MRLKTALSWMLLPLSFSCTAFAAPPPLSAYGDLPSVENMAISLSGKAIAMAIQINGDRRFIVVGEERTPIANAPLGQAKLRSIRWAGDDTVLLVVSNTEELGPDFSTSKYEFFQTYAVPINGGASNWIFRKSRDMVHATFGNYGTRLINGKWQALIGGVELSRSTGRTLDYHFEHGRPSLFSIDLTNLDRNKAARSASEGHWRDWLVDANGNVAVTLDLDSVTGKWQIANSTGKAIASGVDKQGNIGLVSFDSTGSQLIYSFEDEPDRKTQWMQVPLAGGPAQEFLADIAVDRTFIDPTNDRMMGYLPNDGSNRPVLFDTAKQAILRKVYRAFPARHVTIMEWTPTMSHVLLRTSGNGDPGTWFLVDLVQMKAEPIGDERPQILSDQVGAVSVVKYKAGDGLEMDGILTLPPGREGRNLPVVMFPHGGPNAHDSAEFDWWAQAFASRGYAVFQPNFRGSTNRDDAFRNAGNGEWGRKMQTDISDGLGELVRLGIVDPRRVCIMGASYGGYAALAGVTLQQGLYRCSVAVAPVSDLKELDTVEFRESGENKMVRANWRQMLGDPKNFDAVSPRKHAGEASAPIMLIHGKDDTVVPFRHSSSMASALRSAGKPVELIELREEDHWMSRSATRQQMLEAAMRFIKQHNPPQ